MSKKLTKREKEKIFSDELQGIDVQERDKDICMQHACSLRLDLVEDNNIIYLKEGNTQRIFHQPVNSKKIWTETHWILQELIYQKLKAEGKTWDSHAKS